mmetsp:Transcript_11835/g.28267  ORF Transcript_11835/g.28267 Transcript_11835/m.28267 type:complete len:246 (-) Transcript_11835:3838-4575(-)
MTGNVLALHLPRCDIHALLLLAGLLALRLLMASTFWLRNRLERVFCRFFRRAIQQRHNRVVSFLLGELQRGALVDGAHGDVGVLADQSFNDREVPLFRGHHQSRPPVLGCQVDLGGPHQQTLDHRPVPALACDHQRGPSVCVRLVDVGFRCDQDLYGLASVRVGCFHQRRLALARGFVDGRFLCHEPLDDPELVVQHRQCHRRPSFLVNEVERLGIGAIDESFRDVRVPMCHRVVQRGAPISSLE